MHRNTLHAVCVCVCVYVCVCVCVIGNKRSFQVEEGNKFLRRHR